MREFFQGWRRKTGLVTLAMACVLTAAWMRSYVTADLLVITTEKGSYQTLSTMLGGVRWTRWTSESGHGIAPNAPRLQWQSEEADFYRQREAWSSEVVWRWNRCGFDFLKADIRVRGSGQLVRWAVPYWSLVLPLTLLSAWLILIKPRPAKSAKEPSHV